MIVKGGPKTSFTISQFVTLAIPLKNRLSTEATRFPCYIIKKVHNAYALLCIKGLLKRFHQAFTLKAVLDNVTFDILDSLLP
jgi:hypothetical protein